MRPLLTLALLAAALAACSKPPPPLPMTGPIIYDCADGTQLRVDFQGDEARVAIVGGPSMALENAGSADAPMYTNGRYTLRGRGAHADWAVGRTAAVSCNGR